MGVVAGLQVAGRHMYVYLRRSERSPPVQCAVLVLASDSRHVCISFALFKCLLDGPLFNWHLFEASQIYFSCIFFHILFILLSLYCIVFRLNNF